jgi:hypothetical protein
MTLSDRQRHLAEVSVQRYIEELRQACQEDQGTPEGKPGTVGHTMQIELQETLDALKKE